MTDENVTPEPKHALREENPPAITPATDPAEDFTPPAEIPEPHDDVDVALQVGKDVKDGKGDEEPGESDFQGYADPSADEPSKEDTN